MDMGTTTGTQQSGRLTWLDWMKTIGMWTIICNHFYAPISSLHLSVMDVPLFFIISGYLAKIEDSWSVFWRKICRSLIIPYFSLSIIRVGINWAMVPTWQPLDKIWLVVVGWLAGFNCWHNIPCCAELWFVYVLILIKIIFQFSKAHWKSLAVIGVLAILYAYFVPKYIVFPQDTFWSVLGLGLGMLFYLTGYIFRRFHRRFLDKERWWHIATLTVLSGVLCWLCGNWNGYSGIGIGLYGQYLSLCLLGGICGTLFIYGLCKTLDTLFMRWLHHDLAYIRWHSSASIVVLAWHIPFVIRLLHHPLSPYPEINACLCAALIQIAFTPLLWIIISYVPVLVGNRK